MTDHPNIDERVRALRRRALLAERLLVDLGGAGDFDVAAGMLVQALVAVAGVDVAELLAHPPGTAPEDGDRPAIVLARAGRSEELEPPADAVRHRALDVARGLELVVEGDTVPPVAFDRALSALGTIFDRIGAEQALLHQARTDVLTGLLNRRAMDERIETELARIERLDRPLSLLLIDLDEFKQVNDTLGHAVGDDLLRATADTMRRVARAADEAGRLGGDEFALLLPGTPRAGAETVALRLRDELSALDHAVSASVGIATIDGDAVPTVAELVGRADEAMYAAKREGTSGVAHATGASD